MAPAVTREEAERRIRELQESYAAEVRRIYADAERQMIGRVARRIERGIDTTDGQGWAERKLAEVQALNREIQGEISDLRKLDPRIEQAVTDAYNAGADKSAAELIAAKLPDLNADMAFARGSAVRTLAAATVDALSSTHLRILRTAQDIYRQTIGEAASQVLTGTMTRRQAAQMALNRFADKGVTGFVDSAGRSWDMASYAEMAVRSTANQAANQGHSDKLEAAGYDLVIVSASTESCPLCNEWEGKVLSLTGRTPGYPTIDEAAAAGLFHANCTHTTGIYLPGVTRPMDLLPLDQRQDNYKERQQQRYNERMIRKWKNREAAAITDQERAGAKAKVGEWQARQRAFIAETDRRRDYGRESITRAR